MVKLETHVSDETHCDANLDVDANLGVDVDVEKEMKEMKETKERCLGRTKLSIRCSRMIKKGHFCFQHNKQPYFEKEKECPVCMDELDADVYPLECGHWVHDTCTLSEECPLCRAKLTRVIGSKQKVTDSEPFQRFLNFLMVELERNNMVLGYTI